jgi:hypothetical protein
MRAGPAAERRVKRPRYRAFGARPGAANQDEKQKRSSEFPLEARLLRGPAVLDHLPQPAPPLEPDTPSARRRLGSSTASHEPDVPRVPAHRTEPRQRRDNGETLTDIAVFVFVAQTKIGKSKLSKSFQHDLEDGRGANTRGRLAHQDASVSRKKIGLKSPRPHAHVTDAGYEPVNRNRS